MELGKAIKKRKSVKYYSGKKVDWRRILRAMDYVRFAPMAGNMYSVKFILVSDRDKIKSIERATQQEFVGKAEHLIVVVSDREKVKKMYDYYDKGFAAQQAGAAIQNLLLGLTEEKISSCWIGLFDDNIVKRELEISDSMVVEAIISVGMESTVKKEKEKPKKELDNLIFFDSWGKGYMGEDTKQKASRR